MASSVRKTAGRFGRKIALLWCVSSFGCLSSTGNQTTVKVPYYNTPDFSPLWISDSTAENTLHTIGAFQFIDQYGDSITKATVDNKIYIADFFYSACPSICPKMTTNLKALYTRYLNNGSVCFISHSVTPERDSVAALKKYAAEKGVHTHQWHFVTGNKNDIYTLARRSYFVEQQQGFTKDSSVFLHTENFILVDQKGHIRGIYNGTLPAEIPRIEEDIDELLKEQ